MRTTGVILRIGVTSLMLLFIVVPGFAQLEIPTIVDGCQTVKHGYYTLCYSEKHEQPIWVAYSISHDEARGEVPRKDAFKEDPGVRTGSASLEDYKGSGYDRGHLAPAADMKINPTAMNESFYLSNMSPQVPGFNRGIWKMLEAWVREKAFYVTRDGETELYVVTGPILTEGLKMIGENNVSVPEFYYKVIYDPSDGGATAGVAFLMKNEPSKLKPTDNSFIVPIDSVEVLTGIDFFSELEDSREELIESNTEIVEVPEISESKVKTADETPKEKEVTVQRCKGITGSGTQCKRKAEPGSDYCWQHKKK